MAVKRKEKSIAGQMYGALVLQVGSIELLLAGQEDVGRKLDKLRAILAKCEELVTLDLRAFHRATIGSGDQAGTNVVEDELNWEQVAREAAEPARRMLDRATSWLMKGDKKWREQQQVSKGKTDAEEVSAMHENLHAAVRDQILALHAQFRGFFSAVYGESLKRLAEQQS
jgi:hypothetical protein